MENTGRTSICSIVFLDIVGFSKTPDARQVAMKARLNELIGEAVADIAERERIVLDTGDGAAICFIGDPEDALFVTTAVMAAVRAVTGEARQVLRVGINLEPIKMITDVNGRPNVVGDGINVAQRVMSFASDDEILVSRSYFEVVARLREGNEDLFRYLGAKTDKHVREHQVYAISPELEAAYSRPPGSARDAAAPVRGAPSVTVAEILGEETLAAETRRLAERIGPLATVIVRRTANSAPSVEEFYAGISATIPDSADRADFVAGAPVALDPDNAPALSEKVLADATRHLADHIGPLARIMVKKAAESAADRHQLYALLGEQISDEAARSRFLAAAKQDGG